MKSTIIIRVVRLLQAVGLFNKLLPTTKLETLETHQFIRMQKKSKKNIKISPILSRKEIFLQIRCNITLVFCLMSTVSHIWILRHSHKENVFSYYVKVFWYIIWLLPYPYYVYYMQSKSREVENLLVICLRLSKEGTFKFPKKLLGMIPILSFVVIGFFSITVDLIIVYGHTSEFSNLIHFITLSLMYLYNYSLDVTFMTVFVMFTIFLTEALKTIITHQINNTICCKTVEILKEAQNRTHVAQFDDERRRNNIKFHDYCRVQTSKNRNKTFRVNALIETELRVIGIYEQAEKLMKIFGNIILYKLVYDSASLSFGLYFAVDFMSKGKAKMSYNLAPIVLRLLEMVVFASAADNFNDEVCMKIQACQILSYKVQRSTNMM